MNKPRTNTKEHRTEFYRGIPMMPRANQTFDNLQASIGYVREAIPSQLASNLLGTRHRRW